MMILTAKETMTPLMQIYEWNIAHFFYIANYVVETNNEAIKKQEQAMRRIKTR